MCGEDNGEQWWDELSCTLLRVQAIFACPDKKAGDCKLSHPLFTLWFQIAALIRISTVVYGTEAVTCDHYADASFIKVVSLVDLWVPRSIRAGAVHNAENLRGLEKSQKQVHGKTKKFKMSSVTLRNPPNANAGRRDTPLTMIFSHCIDTQRGDTSWK